MLIDCLQAKSQQLVLNIKMLLTLKIFQYPCIEYIENYLWVVVVLDGRS